MSKQSNIRNLFNYWAVDSNSYDNDEDIESVPNKVGYNNKQIQQFDDSYSTETSGQDLKIDLYH